MAEVSSTTIQAVTFTIVISCVLWILPTGLWGQHRVGSVAVVLKAAVHGHLGGHRGRGADHYRWDSHQYVQTTSVQWCIQDGNAIYYLTDGRYSDYKWLPARYVRRSDDHYRWGQETIRQTYSKSQSANTQALAVPEGQIDAMRWKGLMILRGR